jgi:drug/metabolite transporter (DMT)-like permease
MLAPNNGHQPAPPAVNRQLPLLILLPVIWALHFAFIKKIDAEDAVLTALAALLGGISGLYFLALLIKGQLFAVSFNQMRFFCIAGLFAYLLPLTAELLAAPHVDAGILTLIVALTPVFTVALAISLRLIRASKRLLLAVFAGLIGVLLLMLGYKPAGSSSIVWVIIACSVPLFYAIDALYVEHYWPKELNALQIAFGESLVAFLLILGILMISGTATSEISIWFAKRDFIILCLITALEVFLFFYLVGKVGAVLVNIASYLVLPAGFFWGWIMFDEVLTPVGFTCSIFAVAALLLAGNGGEKISTQPER